MEKLTIKELTPYLPYGLKLWHAEWEEIVTMDAVGDGSEMFSIIDVPEYAKPILRPLLDLTKEIEVNGEKFEPMLWLEQNSQTDVEYGFLNAISDDWESAETKFEFAPYSIIEKLFEWHFDVFGLIEKGLAIDKNTI